MPDARPGAGGGVPVQPQTAAALLGYTTPLYDGPSQLELAHKLGLDGMWIPVNGFCGIEEEVHPMGASYQDEWGVTYVKNGWPIMVQTDTPIKSRADWERYTMPKARAPHRTACCLPPSKPIRTTWPSSPGSSGRSP